MQAFSKITSLFGIAFTELLAQITNKFRQKEKVDVHNNDQEGIPILVIKSEFLDIAFGKYILLNLFQNLKKI